MPLREQASFSKRFHQQLEQIRAKIATLPADKRSDFRSLADQADQDRCSMEDDCTKAWEMVDDMRLKQAMIDFDIWSAAENLRQRFNACLRR